MSQLLIIAGFEANGFAGLTRDLQLCHALGETPYAIATTLTAQNNVELLAASAVDPVIIKQQLAALINDVSVVKIGLLPNSEIAQTIADWLAQLKTLPLVILDPINLHSGTGLPFSAQPLAQIVAPLLRYTQLITPNADELCALATLAKADSQSAQYRVAHFYKSQPDFNGQVYLTGGHSHETHTHVTDTLFQKKNDVPVQCLAQWQQTRLATRIRGTGCYLSTAVACAVNQGYGLNDAITLANAKMHQQFQAKLLSGCGQFIEPCWPTSITAYPQVSNANTQTAFLSLPEKQGLYPVVDSVAWLKRLAAMGIKTMQLRIKNASETQLRSAIKQAVQLQHQYQLQLFINDHWQLAIECQAFGVHLGQEDVVTANVDLIRSAGLRLGISTHGDYEFLRAYELQPSYLAVGAIYPTRTKDMTGKIQGLTRLTRYCKLQKEIPIVAIGGITESNIAEVAATHTDFIAVVTAITEAPNPERAVQQLQQQMSEKATVKNVSLHC